MKKPERRPVVPDLASEMDDLPTMTKLRMACEPDTHAATLDKLSRSSSERVRLSVACHPNTSPATLAILARDDNPDVKSRAIKNPNLSESERERLNGKLGGSQKEKDRVDAAKNTGRTLTLTRLSRDRADPVRLAVASNPRCPPTLLVHLSRDSAESVRRAVARHPATPPDILLALSGSGNTNVAADVAGNRNAPAGALAALAGCNSDLASDLVRQAVAKNPGTPPDVLALLSRDKVSSVRALAVSNPNVPLDTLVRVGLSVPGIGEKGEADNAVRLAARTRLANAGKKAGKK